MCVYIIRRACTGSLVHEKGNRLSGLAKRNIQNHTNEIKKYANMQLIPLAHVHTDCLHVFLSFITLFHHLFLCNDHVYSAPAEDNIR